MPTDTIETAAAEAIQREMAKIVGEKNVTGAEPEQRKSERRKKNRKQVERRQVVTRLTDCAIDGLIPAVMVSPASVDEIAGIVRLADEKDYVVVPAGGMTKRNIGAATQRIDILLRLNRFNQTLHYDAGDLTLGVGAGTTIAEIQKILAPNSQFLPLDPMLAQRATAGGVLATNASGPLRSGFGGARDFCIGVNFVTGDGKVAKGGGKVVKNVAGYDLMKLMIGSMGTLGVITSANFKVFPRLPQTCTFVCECKNLAAASLLRDRIAASPLAIMCLEMISPRAQEYLVPAAEVRDPDHYAPLAGMQHDIPWQVVVRAGGSSALLKRYRNELSGAVTREFSGAEETDFWQNVSDFEETVMSRHRNAMVMNLNVMPSAVSAAYEAAEQSAQEHNLLNASVGRAAIGSLVFAFMPMGVDPPSAMQFANVASALRSRLPKGSSAVAVRCPREAKDHFDVWGSSPNDLSIMRGIRSALDPKLVLNRGRFIV